MNEKWKDAYENIRQQGGSAFACGPRGWLVCQSVWSGENHENQQQEFVHAMNNKSNGKSRLASPTSSLMGFLLLGALAIGFMAWFFFWMDGPAMPDNNVGVTPPGDNIPRAGKQWWKRNPWSGEGFELPVIFWNERTSFSALAGQAPPGWVVLQIQIY
jgi:hypothetical protein